MARPTRPKDIKPKADGEAALVPAAVPGGGGGGGGGLDLKFIITIVAILLCTSLTSAASVYFLAPMVLLPAVEDKLSKIAHAAGGGEEGAAEGEGAESEGLGLNLELDEFTVNLKDDPAVSGSQYLRAKVSLKVGIPKGFCPELEPGGAKHAQAFSDSELAGGKLVGAALPLEENPEQYVASGGGAAVSPYVACSAKFKEDMAKYVPTIRDVINAALMKRTAGTLATLEGQEALKDEVKEAINQFTGEEFPVQRVNFQDFIIQK